MKLELCILLNTRVQTFLYPTSLHLTQSDPSNAPVIGSFHNGLQVPSPLGISFFSSVGKEEKSIKRFCLYHLALSVLLDCSTERQPPCYSLPCGETSLSTEQRESVQLPAKELRPLKYLTLLMATEEVDLQVATALEGS